MSFCPNSWTDVEVNGHEIEKWKKYLATWKHKMRKWKKECRRMTQILSPGYTWNSLPTPCLSISRSPSTPVTPCPFSFMLSCDPVTDATNNPGLSQLFSFLTFISCVYFKLKLFRFFTIWDWSKYYQCWGFNCIIINFSVYVFRCG